MICDHMTHPDGSCEGEVKNRSPMTEYVWEISSGKPDPNKVILCNAHYERYVEYWSEMWAMYNSGRL